MSLEELIELLNVIATNHPELKEQPVSCYYASKRIEFGIDTIRVSIQDQTAETIINIS